jgi:hypothetical protein
MLGELTPCGGGAPIPLFFRVLSSVAETIAM